MVIRSLFLRPLLHAPFRFAVTVVGVAAGVASVVATVSASRAAVSSLERGVGEISGPDTIEVTRVGGIGDDALRALAPLAEDAEIAPVVEEIALLPELDEPVRVLGLDLLLPGAAPADFATHTPDPGAIERMLRGDAVLLAEPLARRLHAAAGGDIELSVRARRVRLPVAATFTPAVRGTAWDRVVIMDVGAAEELFGRRDLLDRIELRPRPGVAAGALATRARAVLPPGDSVGVPAERGARAGRMVRALEFNLTALSGISLLVGAVLVATTLATSVVQRRQTIALLRSLGASPGQLARALLVEALAIGLLGGVGGVLAGVLGARLALAAVRATVAAVIQGAPPTSIAFEADVAGAGVLLAVLVCLAAAVLPLAEALRTPPIQGLIHERPERLGARAGRRTLLAALLLALLAAALAQAPPIEDLPFAALAASLALLGALLAASSPLVDRVAALGHLRIARRLGSPFRLASAALAAGRTRSAWAAGAVGVSVALAVAVAIMVHSFRTTVVDWSAQALRSDLWVRPLAGRTGFGVGRLDPEVVRIARRLFGDAAVDPFYTTDTTVDGHPVTLGAGEMAVVARFGGVPFASGRDSRDVFRETLTSHGAIVNEPFANRFGVRAGDEVRIATPKGEVTRRVIDVFYDYSRQNGMVVIDANDFLKLFPDDGPQEVAVFLGSEDGARGSGLVSTAPPPSRPYRPSPTLEGEAEGAREELMRALGGRFLVEAFLNRELRREVITLFDRTFAITTALEIVAAVVAGIAVLTVLFALVDERRRDLAVARAVGASARQVLALVVIEALLLGLAGVVSGLTAGGLVGVVLVRVVNLQSFGWTLRFLPPWRELATTAVVLAAACLAAGVPPALAAARVTPGEGLREEG